MKNTDRCSSKPDDFTFLEKGEIENLCYRTLSHHRFSEKQAKALTEFLVAAEIDGCRSHGIYRLLYIIDSLRKGGVVADAQPQIEDVAPGLVKVNAKGGLSPLAFISGVELLKRKCEESGVAILAINHCVHVTALWVEVEKLARQGIVSLACNPTHSYVAPYGGLNPLLGTNPFAFGWPRDSGTPFIFDFATSEASRGDIELHHREKKPIPEGWGVDRLGNPTQDPGEVLNFGAMLPFGGHKGSALSIMIELLAGPLIGDMTSLESSAHDQGRGCIPYHGEVIIAIDPSVTRGTTAKNGMAGAEQLFSTIIDQGARLPSQRRYEERKKNISNGVKIDTGLLKEIEDLVK